MAKANAKPAAEQPATAPEGGKPEELQDGQALAEAGAVAAVPVPDPIPDPEPPIPATEVERCSVRVLAAVTIAEVRYTPDAVILDLPVALAQAYAGSVDPHPDAVAYALSVGATVHEFEG